MKLAMIAARLLLGGILGSQIRPDLEALTSGLGHDSLYNACTS